MIVNGRVTNRVDVGRCGCRQVCKAGCPLAPALYILLTDYLIHCIKTDCRISGLVDPRGNEHKVSGLADDMLLALMPVPGSLEAALDVIDVFSLALGCLVNWRKTKVICIHIRVTPACINHITRVTGDDSHPYLGLPFMESDENAEVGRQVCVRFIKKARMLNIMVLSLPARVLVVNHILTVMLWYFFFAWAPSAQDFKRLQNIITNFLWGKELQEDRGCNKVA